MNRNISPIDHDFSKLDPRTGELTDPRDQGLIEYYVDKMTSFDQEIESYFARRNALQMGLFHWVIFKDECSNLERNFPFGTKQYEMLKNIDATIRSVHKTDHQDLRLNFEF